MSNSSTPQQLVSDSMQDIEGIEYTECTAAETFVQNLAGLVNQNDVETMIRAQKQMLQRFEKTNEMLLNCNALSQSRLKYTNDDFRRHVKLLTEMKKDLDYVFRKVRSVKQKLSQQYPIAYAEAQPQRSSLAEEAEDETEVQNANKAVEAAAATTSAAAAKVAMPSTSSASAAMPSTSSASAALPSTSSANASNGATATTVEYVQMEETIENGKPIENELIKRVCSIETANPNDSETSEDTG